MTTGRAVRGWGRWSRPVVLVGVLAIGTACGGSGNEASSADVHRGAAAERTTEAPAGAKGQQVRPSAPVGTGLGQAPATALDAGTGRDRAASLAGAPGTKAPAPAPPPPPELAGRPPQAPPNTVALSTLHQQGRTHVLR